MQFLRYCHSYFDLEEVIGPELVHRQAYPTFASLFDMTASSNQNTKNICENKKLKVDSVTEGLRWRTGADI